MFHSRGPTLWELTREALSSTERGYDLLAPKFDYTPFRTPQAVLGPVAEQLSRGGPYESALDLCCGTGAAMHMLLPLCQERVVGVDFSQGMLEVGHAKGEHRPGNERLSWVRADARALPFRSEFDLAVCFGALGHIRRRHQPGFIQQVARALRPRGQFVTLSSALPSLWSLQYWFSRSFNAAMHLRNHLMTPPFVMYYLQFLLPQALELLESNGFKVEIRSRLFKGRFEHLKLVIATLT